MRDVLLLAHYAAGGIVTFLMFAFAFVIHQQRAVIRERDAEIELLSRREALRRAGPRELQEILTRASFEEECG